MEKYDKIFSTAKNKGTESFPLATGYISTTVIFFEEEKIFAKIEAKGYVEIFDSEDNLLQSLAIPSQTGGREVCDEVECSVQNGILTFRFPVVEWIDNYPHCDGENDRWDRKVIDYHTVSLKYHSGTAK